MTIVADVPGLPGLKDPTETEISEVDYSGRADPTHLFVGVISVVLVVVGVIGTLTSNSDIETTGLMLFAGLGFGTSVFQLSWNIRGLRFLTYGLGISAAVIVLVGTALVEFNLWSAGIGIFVALAAASSVLQVIGVDRHRPALRALIRTVLGKDVASKDWMLVTSAVVGGVLCLGAAFADQNPSLGLSGLLGSISPIWYLGLVLIVGAFVLGRDSANFAKGLPIILLVLALIVTPAIVFNEPLYPWVAKHVGVTMFFIVHGHVSKHVGSTVAIYQAWPGLFAGIAWLCHVCDFADPMQVARWWPPAIDVAGAIAIRFLGERVGLSTRQSWLAVALWFLANTFGQDYYSPQSMAYFLGLVAFCCAFRVRKSQVKPSITDWLVLVLASCGMAVTHQLTPFMVSAALVVVALFGFSKSRWMWLVTLVPATLWTGIHYSYVSGYLKIDSVGNVAANIATPGSRHTTLSNDLYVHLSVAGQLIAALLLGIAAVLVLLQWRTRLHWMLACCALSGGALLFFSAYGNEGLFRVTIFAIPWLALLAADNSWETISLRGAAFQLLVPAMVVAYLLGAWGIDYGYELRPGDISAINRFEITSRPNAVLISVGYGSNPVLSTGVYRNRHYFNYEDIRTGAIKNGHFDAAASVSVLTQFFSYSKTGAGATRKSREAQYYLITTNENEAQSELRGIATAQEFAAFQSALEKSPDWKVVARTDSATLFRLNLP
jgi:hypothetical protein